MTPLPNSQKTCFKISALLTALTFFLIFLPGLIGIDGMSGGYALSFVSIFLSITCLIVTWLFWKRSLILDRLLKETDLLAHWTYTPSEWQRFTEGELEDQKSENSGVFLIMLAWALFFGILFWIADHEAGFFVFLTLLGIMLFLGIIAFGLPHLRYVRQRKLNGEIRIASNALYFNKSLVYWDSLGIRLEKVSLSDRPNGGPKRLCFELSYLTKIGRETKNYRIPVPRGCESEALEISDFFQLIAPV